MVIYLTINLFFRFSILFDHLHLRLHHIPLHVLRLLLEVRCQQTHAGHQGGFAHDHRHAGPGGGPVKWPGEEGCCLEGQRAYQPVHSFKKKD